MPRSQFSWEDPSRPHPVRVKTAPDDFILLLSTLSHIERTDGSYASYRLHCVCCASLTLSAKNVFDTQVQLMRPARAMGQPYRIMPVAHALDRDRGLELGLSGGQIWI
jgi:hypothetical protein